MLFRRAFGFLLQKPLCLILINSLIIVVSCQIVTKIGLLRRHMHPLEESRDESSNFFLLITRGSPTITSRSPTMAIESICKHHIGHKIYLFYTERNNSDIREYAAQFEPQCNIYVRRLLIDELLLGTPLQDWFEHRKEYLLSGKYWFFRPNGHIPACHIVETWRLVC